MALRAAAGAMEISLPRSGIACLQIGKVDGTATADARRGLVFLIVDECDDCGKVRIAEAERRHALVHAPLSHGGANLVPPEVLCHERGSGEVRAGFTARSVAAMAEAALRAEDALSGLHLFQRIGLRRRGLRRWRRLRGGNADAQQQNRRDPHGRLCRVRKRRHHKRSQP